jgi:hypothetical protein
MGNVSFTTILFGDTLEDTLEENVIPFLTPPPTEDTLERHRFKRYH